MVINSVTTDHRTIIRNDRDDGDESKTVIHTTGPIFGLVKGLRDHLAGSSLISHNRNSSYACSTELFINDKLPVSNIGVLRFLMNAISNASMRIRDYARSTHQAGIFYSATPSNGKHA